MQLKFKTYVFFGPGEYIVKAKAIKKIACKVKQAGFCCHFLSATVILSHIIKLNLIQYENPPPVLYISSALHDLPDLWHGKTKPKPTDPDSPVLGLGEDM